MKMHVAVTLLAVVLGAGCASAQEAAQTASEQASAGVAGAGGTNEDIAAESLYSAELLGESEVPGPGSPEGRGEASIDLSQDGRVCVQLTVEGLDTVTAAHIHAGAQDEAGDPVVELPAPTEGSSNGCVDAEGEIVADIVENPESYYVNVHTEQFPQGAVRGQLGPPEA
jgi:hypothetical protein